MEIVSWESGIGEFKDHRLFQSRYLEALGVEKD